MIYLCHLFTSTMLLSPFTFTILYFGSLAFLVDAEQWDIADLADQLGCTDFSGLLSGTGFEYELGDDKAGPFTVYVPTNDAFDQIPPDVMKKLNDDANWQLMHDLVAFHITRGNLSYYNWTNEQIVPTALEGSNIRLNFYKNQTGEVSEYCTCGSTLIKADQKATNGMIQVIDRVMYNYPTSDMADFVHETYNLSSLEMLIQISDSFQYISGQNLTLFAPTDTAFSTNSSTFERLLSSNQTDIVEYLASHIVDTTLYKEGIKWKDGLLIQTISGKGLRVQVLSNKDISVNGVPLAKSDISVTNGVIHLIDSLII